MPSSRFTVSTTLEGYVNALKPSGKYNNCTFAFTLSKEDLEKFDKAYEDAIALGTNKMQGRRFTTELPKWDESGFLKYSYGGEQGNPMFPWVDTEGKAIDIETQIWKGTQVRLIVDLKDYQFGTKIGCSMKVRGAQVIKLCGPGGSDAGDLELEDVAAIFGTTDGFKQSAPSYVPNDAALATDDEDIPF